MNELKYIKNKTKVIHKKDCFNFFRDFKSFTGNIISLFTLSLFRINLNLPNRPGKGLQML